MTPNNIRSGTGAKAEFLGNPRGYDRGSPPAVGNGRESADQEGRDSQVRQHPDGANRGQEGPIGASRGHPGPPPHRELGLTGFGALSPAGGERAPLAAAVRGRSPTGRTGLPALWGGTSPSSEAPAAPGHCDFLVAAVIDGELMPGVLYARGGCVTARDI